MNIFRMASAASLIVVLAGCSSGGGSSSNPPPPPAPAPSALSYPVAPTLTRGTAMTALSPTVTGIVVSYSITPTLPAGIAINATTGVISGTPTAIAATAIYQVTATNASGSTNAAVAITVNDAAPDISYPQATQNWSTGAPVSLNPSSTGGTVVTWSVNPALPAGLAINPASGVISGTPTTAIAASAYVVTATNSGGSDTFNLSIAVLNSLLIDLGHADAVLDIRHDGQRILSFDIGGHAVLMNAVSGAILATRDGVRESPTVLCTDPCDQVISLEGNTAAMRSDDSLVLLDAASGAGLASIGIAGGPIRWWRLSSDGSYVAAATDTNLTVWSRTGGSLFTIPGNYSSAKAFGAPAELRIGGGPAGASVVENLVVPSGTSTLTAAHQGTFHSWFDDGEKFLSNVGTTVWVYSREATQLDLATLDTLEELHGQGEWFWTHSWAPKFVKIYRVGASATPAATHNFTNLTRVIPSGDTLGAINASDPLMSVIDLSGATPERTDFTTTTRQMRSYAAASASDWVVGADLGIMFGEVSVPSPQLYSYGEARSIAANADTIAVATSSGRLLQFDAQTHALTREIPQPASKIKISADGTRIVGGPLPTHPPQLGFDFYAANLALRVYSLQSGNLLQEWPTGGPDFDRTMDFDVASAADALARTIYRGAGPTDDVREVTTLADNPLWANVIPGGHRIYLSPNGMVTAIDGVGAPTPPGVNLYTNGTISGAVPGFMAGWLDDARLVVNRYVPGVPVGTFVFDHVEVISTAGVTQSTLNIPLVSDLQPVSATSFYVPSRNIIYDAGSGSAIWSSTASTRGVGAVAGSRVVFASGSTVRIEPQ